MDNFIKLSCENFVQILASKQPVPGGGGTSAYVAALGVALGNMVGSLTLGKKKYVNVQEDITRLKEQADALQTELLELVAKDAAVFEPLSKAYGLPKDTEEQRQKKAMIMEEALKNACDVPFNIMQKCCKAIELEEEFAAKGTAIAISDAGCGALLCKAALQAAGLNVFINTRLMQDRNLAGVINLQADEMLKLYTARAEAVYENVKAKLR